MREIVLSYNLENALANTGTEREKEIKCAK